MLPRRQNASICSIGKEILRFDRPGLMEATPALF
jgi:hypothetical protein